jgi:hypothetical protein
MIAKNKTQLSEAIQEIEANRELFKTSVEALNRVSNRFNGLKRAVEIIEDIKH